MRVAARASYQLQGAELFGSKEVISQEIQVIVFLRIINKFIRSIIMSSSLATSDDKSDFRAKTHVHGVLFIRVVTSVYFIKSSVFGTLFSNVVGFQYLSIKNRFLIVRKLPLDKSVYHVCRIPTPFNAFILT